MDGAEKLNPGTLRMARAKMKKVGGIMSKKLQGTQEKGQEKKKAQTYGRTDPTIRPAGHVNGWVRPQPDPIFPFLLTHKIQLCYIQSAFGNDF